MEGRTKSYGVQVTKLWRVGYAGELLVNIFLIVDVKRGSFLFTGLFQRRIFSFSLATRTLIDPN